MTKVIRLLVFAFMAVIAFGVISTFESGVKTASAAGPPCRFTAGMTPAQLTVAPPRTSSVGLAAYAGVYEGNWRARGYTGPAFPGSESVLVINVDGGSPNTIYRFQGVTSYATYWFFGRFITNQLPGPKFTYTLNPDGTLTGVREQSLGVTSALSDIVFSPCTPR